MSDKNFTIYKSSAGSGKTFTLVKEYLALALNDEADPPQAYRHILAVTFTNKAASEMKERIIKALKELSEEDYGQVSGGTKTLLIELKKHKQLNKSKALDDTIIRKRAQRVITAILHNYSDFAIGTIDSFVHKVVRTFAFDLKIPMSFEIEMDDDKLLTQAIDLLLAQIGNDERLTKALVEFTESKTDDEKSWHIENDLKEFAKNLLNEDGAVHIEKLKHLSVDDFFGIKEVLAKEIKLFETAVSTAAQKGADTIKKVGLTSKDFYYGDKGIAAYFEKLAGGRMDYIQPNTYVQATAGDDKWAGGKVTGETKSAIEGIKPVLLDCFVNIQQLKDESYANYILFSLINKSIYSLAVLNEIEKLLTEYKTQNNILHISEFNKMIAKIVLNEPIPFIYERLGERYNNYLIDEFQDTSVLQFQNLLPLIDNSLANGHFTMLVGDGKQAIYRWRGGEVEQFAMLPNVFKHNNNPLVLEREEALIRNHIPEVLDKNYRSKREVIEFNNSVFRVLSEKLNQKFLTIYEGLEQGFNPDNTGGFVQVEFIEGEKDVYREQNKKRTLELIHQLIADNYLLKDISILVRKNTDGSDVANYLTENGIDVISSDSLLLSNSAEINFLHSLLKYLANTADTIIQTEIVEYLVASKFVTSITLPEVLQNRIGVSSILKNEGVEFSVTQLSKMALYELCEELIRLFKLNATPNAYIQLFLDEVLNYSIKKNNNLNDFIEYWEDKKQKASLIIPQGMNAVNIMTIHRSKGLEFPVVILPFSNTETKNGKKNLWIDLANEKLPNLPSAIVPTNQKLEETIYSDLYQDEKSKSMLDNLNVLYVGFTRAEERLYVLSGMPGRNPDKCGSVSDMMAHYYMTKGEWQEGKLLYSFGEAVKHKQNLKDKQTSSFELVTFNSSRWRESIKMRAAAPSIWNTNMAEVKKDYGNVVHTALAKVKVPEDVDVSLTAMCAEGLITVEEKDVLKITLTTILNLPKLKPLFAKGLIVKNEAEIVTSSGELYRPDRVVIDGKKAVIIDYKTGEERKKHKEQIIGYSDLLSEMGYIVTDRLLVYIESEKVVSI